jgi:DNA repair exonuclease SbcCD nuclease subunit
MMMASSTLQNRKLDLLDNFLRIVDYARKNKPDMLLISGDIFDSDTPSYATFSIFLKALRELSDLGIKIFLVGGNHDVPRPSRSGVMSIDILKNANIAAVFPISRAVRKKSTIIKGKSVNIYGASYGLMQADDLDMVSKRLSKTQAGDFDILMIHAKLISDQRMKMQKAISSNDPDPPQDNELASGFDYVALGQDHKYFQVDVNGSKICNAGSIEKLDWSESGQRKGFIWAELGDSETKAEFIELPCRKMEIGTIDLSTTDSKESAKVDEAISAILAKNRDKKSLFKVEFKGAISLQTYASINLSKYYKKYRKWYYHLELDRNQLDVVDSSGTNRPEMPLSKKNDLLVDLFARRMEMISRDPSQSEEDRMFLREVKNRGAKYLRSRYES